MAAASAERGFPTEDQTAVLAFLAGGDAFGGKRPRRVDTHAAHVFLTGDRAWKIKSAVRYPYLDFTTLEARKAALEAELRLNRRSAPDLYLAVRPITRDDTGRLALDGEGAPVEWVLEMRRFADGALLEDLAGRHALDAPLLMRLADRVTALHAASETLVTDGAARIGRIIDGNAASCAAVAAILDRRKVALLFEDQRRELARHARTLDMRARGGRVRRGHGDLHLANIALIDGVPTLFDCLEFSDELATVDVLYDLAFLLMDLWHRGLRVEANIVANRYLDVAPQGALGYALLPLFVSIRATIRAHVLAAESMRERDRKLAERARAYLTTAIDALDIVPPKLVAIGGLSGTGKSTLARALGGRFGRAPGARVLRSDVFRKRLAGVPPETRLAPATYTPASSAETYEALLESAEDHLGCGTTVILDAVFLQRSERDVAEALSAHGRVPFAGIWLEAPEADRVARVLQRSGDASDATAEVVREQSRRTPGELGAWHRLRANRDLTRMASAARAMIDRARRWGHRGF